MERTGSSNSESTIFSNIPIVDLRRIYSDKLFAWNSDGSVGFTMRFNGINDSGYRSSDYLTDYESISKMLSRLVSDNITIQFQVVRSSNLDGIPDLPLDMPKMLHERVNFLRKLVKNCEILKNDLYISVNSYPGKVDLSIMQKIKSSYATLSSVFNGDKGDEEILNAKFMGIRKRLQDLERIESSITNFFQSQNIKTERLDSREEYTKLYRSIFAPNKSSQKELKVDEKVNFRKDVFRNIEAQEMPEYILLDDYYHQVFELDYVSSTSDFAENAISRIVNAPFECVYTVNLRSLPKRESKELVQKVIKQDMMSISMSGGGAENADNMDAANDINRLVQTQQYMSETGQGVIEFNANFVYRKKLTQLNEELKRMSLNLEEFSLKNREEMYFEIFSHLGDSEWKSPFKGQWEALCTIAPATTNIKNKKFEVTGDLPENLTYMLPMFGFKRKDLQHYGVNHFYTDDLGVETFELFDPALNSWGTLISGDMGSGKSVAMNVVLANSMTSLLVSGKMPLIRLIDYGGVTSSFFKIIKVLGGEIVNVSKRKMPRINIFDVSVDACYPNRRKLNDLRDYLVKKGVKDDKRELDSNIYTFYDLVMDHEGAVNDKDRIEYIKSVFGVELSNDEIQNFKLKTGEVIPARDKFRTIMAVVEVMLSSNPERLNTFSYEFQYDEVANFVKEIFHQTTDKAPKMTDLIELIKSCVPEEGGQVYLSMISKLERYSINGEYKMFDMDTDVDLENDIIMFDLFGIKSDPFLSSIYTTIIMELISRDMFEKMDRQRVCLMDEVHQALESEGIRDTLVSFFRLSRKYKFPILLASQLPTDWFDKDPKVGKVLVSQATRFIFCGTKKKFVRDETKALYDLSAAQADAIGKAGVQTMGGTKSTPIYAKFLMVSDTKKGKTVNIYRNLLSKFELTLYSSSKEDNAIFKYYLDKLKMSALAACEHIAEDKHVGDQGLIEYLKEGNNTEALKMVDK